MNFIERFLGLYTTSLYREGVRLVEIKSLVWSLKAIKGARKLALIYYLSFVASMMVVAGLFVVTVHGLGQYQVHGSLSFDAALVFGLALFFIGSASVAWALREKRWIEAFGLKKMIDQVLRPHHRPGVAASPQAVETKVEKQPSQDFVTHEDLKRLIEVIIDEKLKKVVSEAVAHSKERERESA